MSCCLVSKWPSYMGSYVLQLIPSKSTIVCFFCWGFHVSISQEVAVNITILCSHVCSCSQVKFCDSICDFYISISKCSGLHTYEPRHVISNNVAF